MLVRNNTVVNKEGIMKTILKAISEAPSLKKWLDQANKPKRHLMTGLQGSAEALSLVCLAEKDDSPVIVVTPNRLAATQLKESCDLLVSDDMMTTIFSAEETLAAEMAIASNDLLMERLQALSQLLTQQKGIVFIPVSGLLKPLLPPKIWRDHVRYLSVGEEVDSLDSLVTDLVNMGYEPQTMISRPGEYARRGSIVDVFPLTSENPVRIDFFDTEIDSIRLFDADTQQSHENIDNITIWPADEWLYPKDQFEAVATALQKDLKSSVGKIKDEEVRTTQTDHFEAIIDQLSEGELPLNARYYIEYFYKHLVPVTAYFDRSNVVIVEDYARINESIARYEEEAALWISEQVVLGEVLPNQRFTVNGKQALLDLPNPQTFISAIQRGLGRLKFDAIENIQYRPMTPFFSQMPLLKQEVERWTARETTVIICVPDKTQQKKLEQTLNDFSIDYAYSDKGEIATGQLQIVAEPLSSGFELPSDRLAVITEKELFNKLTRRRKQSQNLPNAERLKSYNELKKGDYVVHVNHGIGVYKGIKTLEISGIHKQYVAINYKDGGNLFVPVDQLNLVQKYVSSEAKVPKINKLGGTDWAKTKAKVAAKIEDIADDLIDLYAKRQAEKGFAFSPDTPEQQDFENAFGYQETEDQLRSIREIKADMEKEQPMDRLLVGDVGYGKTEVAMRAIFKCLMDGKQAAILVPTTILAEQHFETFTDRFRDYPFEIGLLSRFRTKAQQKETIEGLRKGSIDIVIGTHRLLSKDVSFLDLGLLVVDEEQRFGVKHKERLKSLRSQVDVLTLTATPIPRTLHMSMLGVRDLSVIETPPANRYPIQTYVMAQNPIVIRDGIEREMARGGQVFYLSNRVETIHQKAEMIRQLVPTANVGIAHGQMGEHELEDVLMAFLERRLDAIVTTTIIETGVDMPNVNTLFIEQADRFGLSQLYQLRGRVGRTNRLAYSYLMYNPNKSLTEVGEQRLQTMREFTDLGSGFKIAMRDLAIRGAGNLLGKQQHGFIDSVGYDLYTQMLNEAVAKRKGEVKTDHSLANIEIDLSVEAYLPDDYLADEHQKVEFYKRIRQIASEGDYREIQDDLIDRFGEFPDAVANLVEIGLIRYLAILSGITEIKQQTDTVRLVFTDKASQKVGGVKLFECLNATTMKAQVTQDGQKLIILFKPKKLYPDQLLTQLKLFLKETASVISGESDEEKE